MQGNEPRTLFISRLFTDASTLYHGLMGLLDDIRLMSHSRTLMLSPNALPRTLYICRIY